MTDLCSGSPTMWFNKEKSLRELYDLKFAVAALASTCGTPGSFEHEMAKNAETGIRRRIDYLYDSLARLLKEPQP